DPAPGSALTASLAEGLEALREPTGVGLLGLRQRLEPLGDLLEALAARRLREPGIHLGELVGLALDGGLEVLLGRADRHAGAGVARLLQEVEVPERVARLGFRGVAEEPADVGIALDVRPARKVEVAPIRLRLAGERVLQVVVRLRPLDRLRHPSSSCERARRPPLLSGRVPITEWRRGRSMKLEAEFGAGRPGRTGSPRR